MTRSRRILPALVLAGVTASLVPLAARAQNTDQDAERLFREGQKLMEARRYGEACPKFEAAYKKDGQLGTLMNLAFCHKEQGSIWYAWLEFREAEVKAAEQKRTDREEFAHQRLAELEKDLAKVVVDVSPKAPLTEVLVEDRRVPEAERGAVFCVEEGQRKLTFRAKGKKPATKLVSITRGERVQHVAPPALEDEPVENLTPPPPATDTPPKPPPPAEDDDPGKTQRLVGWVTLFGGGALFGAGTAYWGIQSLGSVCAGNATSGRCTDHESSIFTLTTTLATVAGVLAGVSVVGGIALVLTAPRSAADKGGASARARVAIHPELGLGWAGLRGDF